MLIKRTAVLGLALSLFANAAFGAGVRMFKFDETPDPREVARVLSQPSPPPGMKMRSIRMLPAGPEGSAVDLKQAAGTPATPASPETPKQTIVATAPAPTATDAAPVAASSIEATAAVYTPRVVPSAPGEDLPSSLGLPVRFAFDSARILPEAYRQLDAVAEGIKLADPRINVVIEGHTDAAGTAPYNLRLSSQRADAVRTYLITRHGVDPRRLRVVGMGEFAPLDKATPYAPENRRVEFRSEG